VTSVSAPASSANLGPGYDVLALALDLRCTVTAVPAAEWQVESGGVPAGAATVDMVRRVASGVEPHAVRIESDIPQARGLGSSAALLVAACVALRPALEPDGVFAAAAAAEGHPDNVAAALHGGLVAVSPSGRTGRLAVHPSLRVIVALPDEELATIDARAVIDATVPRDVAVRTAGRLAMLIEGLRTADSGQLTGALGDEIHELPRRKLTETPGRLIAAGLGAGARYACWSGAGPSVVCFGTEDELDAITEALQAELGGNGEVREVAIDLQGVRIEG
jgi:homoserine kinase